MRLKQFRRAAVAVAVAALVAPAAAAAHGSVFTVTAKTVVGPVPATAGGLVDQTQYVVTNHGYTYVLRESNGASDKGMINFKVLPSAYRNQAGFTKARLLSEGDTGAQPHATCRNVPQLESLAAILAWQGTDPFYNYVPFQSTSAGLEDAASSWIPVVLAQTGVNLATVTDFAAACASIAGTYVPADTTQTTSASLNAGQVSDALAPFQAQVASLQGDVGTLEGENTTLTARIATLEDENEALAAAKTAAEKAAAEALAAQKAAEARPAAVPVAPAASERERKLAVSLHAKRFPGRPGAIALVTGPAGAKVTLTLRGKGGSVLATTTRNLGPEGAAVGALAPSKATLASLAKAGKAGDRHGRGDRRRRQGDRGRDARSLMSKTSGCCTPMGSHPCSRQGDAPRPGLMPGRGAHRPSIIRRKGRPG